MKNDPKCFTLSVGDGANDVNMIQSASIGVGIMGKEGNQAASFSDYALPNFKGLRRLLFWHGRRFGNRAIPFLGLNLFKSILYVAPNLFMNMTNGFSGLSTNVGMYNALFNALNTVLACAGFLLLDQDISFNQDRYVEDAPPLNAPEMNKSEELHAPSFNCKKSLFRNFGQKLSSDIFDRKKMLEEKGVAMNSDGSTNNIGQYIYYTREVVSKSLIFYYCCSLIWAYLSGLFCTFVCLYGFGEILGPDGQTNGFYNQGALMIIANMVSHHIMVLLETRNIDVWIMGWYVFSFGTLFLNIWMNDQLIDEYYPNQWTMMMGNPLFYLVLIIQVFVILAPRLMELCLDYIVFYPEFTKIKAKK